MPVAILLSPRTTGTLKASPSGYGPRQSSEQKTGVRAPNRAASQPGALPLVPPPERPSRGTSDGRRRRGRDCPSPPRATTSSTPTLVGTITDACGPTFLSVTLRASLVIKAVW